MRGRTGTWLVAAAVAVLAMAALVDAVGGGPDGGDSRPSPAPPPPAATTGPIRDAFLQDERVVGRLLLVDEGCGVRTVLLPDVEQRWTPGRRSCSFTSSPGGVVGLRGAVVAPHEPYVALCDFEIVELRRAVGGEGDAGPLAGSLLEVAPGCAPAWRPNGSLTAVRRGEVVDLGRPEALSPPRTVLSRADLERAFGGSPWNLRLPLVQEVGWLDGRLLAAIVRDEGGEGDLLALFRDGGLVATTPSPYEALSGLRVSPRGTYVAARVADAPALVLLDRDGEFVPVGLRGHAITWSRDEVWAAVAAPEAIYVFEAGGRASRFARIPIRALDVFWR